jgi:hypothetical protein
MEKKSLGRGIEDIADIFISQKKENVPARSSATANARKAVGESAHEDGNVSTIDERIKVTRNYFSSEHPLKHDPTERNDAPGIRSIENSLKDRPDACEIEEHVTSIKKIGYLNTPHVQENIVNSLSQHLRRNYNIKKIELAKVSEVSRPGMKNLTEKNILIYVKEEKSR